MTEFEKLVASALLSGGPDLWPDEHDVLVRAIAPRVAAAIDAAHGTQGPKAREILRTDALTALRGIP